MSMWRNQCQNKCNNVDDVSGRESSGRCSSIPLCDFARCKLSHLDDTVGLNFGIRPPWFIAGESFFFFFSRERKDQQIGLREETSEDPGNPPQISRVKKFGDLSGLILFRLEVPHSYVDSFEREPGRNSSSISRDVMYVPCVHTLFCSKIDSISRLRERAKLHKFAKCTILLNEN